MPTSLAAGTYYYYCVATSQTAGSVTSNAATVTVANATYLAQYSLSGTPGATMPATVTDLSGNGNTLTVNGSVQYGASTNPLFSSTGKSLSIASFNLNGRTKYRMHIECGSISKAAANRVFDMGTYGLNLQIGNVYFQTESTTSLGFTSPRMTTDYSAFFSGNRTNVNSYTMDWLVDGDSITLTGVLYDDENRQYSAVSTLTCTGFTAALESGGLYLCNRASGDRPAYTGLKAFYIVEA